MRAAWIEAQRGNLPAAIARARGALTEHPDFYGGWQWLCDWHRQNDETEEAVQAAEKMAALAPLNPVPLGYVGELKLKLDDRSGAKAAFERAFNLDPDYAFAGFKLFHLQVEDGQLTAAEQILKVLRRRGEDHETLACSVELAVAAHLYERAREDFKKLCSSAQSSEWSLAAAAAALDKGGMRRFVDRALAQQLQQSGPVATAVAKFWVHRQVTKGKWALHKRLMALKAKGEAGRDAVLCYLNRLGEALDASRRKGDVTGRLRLRYHFWRILRKHRDWLRPDTTGWGQVGYVLSCIGRPGPVIAWLSDWPDRPEAQSWMLYNLVLMLQRKGRYEESCEIIRYAVGLRHDVDLFETFRIWAAFEEALAGNTTFAQQHLNSLAADKLSPARRPLQVMTQILIDLRNRKFADKKSASRSIRSSLRVVFGDSPPSKSDPYTRGAFTRFIKAAATQGAGQDLRWWARWYWPETKFLWLLPLLLIPFAIAVPGLWVIILAIICVLRKR
jgi:tetratricopeptide (TPR) repeat protein